MKVYVVEQFNPEFGWNISIIETSVEKAKAFIDKECFDWRERCGEENPHEFSIMEMILGAKERTKIFLTTEEV